MDTKICYLDYIQTTSVQQNWKIRIPWKHRISTCFFGWWRSSNLPPKKIPPKVSFCWFGWDVSFMDLGRFCGKSFKAPPGWAGKCGHHRPLARYLCSTFIPGLAGFAITKGSWWLRIPVNNALFLGGEQWQGVSLAVVFVKVPTCIPLHQTHKGSLRVQGMIFLCILAISILNYWGLKSLGFWFHLAPPSKSRPLPWECWWCAGLKPKRTDSPTTQVVVVVGGGVFIDPVKKVAWST